MATNFQVLPYTTQGTSTGAVLTQLGPSGFISWGQGIGNGISAIGWVRDTTPSGQVNWANVTLTPSVRTDWQNFPGDGVLNFRGAWSNAGVTYNVNDIVTDGGMTWRCSSGYTTTSTAGTSTTASPSNEWQTNGTQHWFLWCFEVWKSTTAPTIYIRFEYIAWQNNGQAYLPLIRVKVGTSTDVNGTLGTGAGNQAIGAFNLGSGTAAQNSYGTVNVPEGGYPCFFSGDSTNRFAMLMWLKDDGFQGTCFFCIERSISNTGTYYTTPSGSVTPYWTAIFAGYNSTNNTGTIVMQSLVNTVGSTWLKTGQESTVTTLSCALDHENNPDNWSLWSGQGAGNQSVPALPVYPLVGWVGNPMTAVMTTRVFNSAGNSSGSSDLPANSGLFTQSMYGATRTYLASRNANCFGSFGPPNNNSSSSNFQNALAMRYD